MAGVFDFKRRESPLGHNRSILETAWSFGGIYVGLKYHQTRAKFLQDEEAEEKFWKEVHAKYAYKLWRVIRRLRGWWVKVGQFLSSRPDMLPPEYIQELSKLQDAMPTSSFDVVRKIVEDELGRPLEEVFSDFDEEALASASIAQVHRATLKDGTNVVVKIQHPEVERLLEEDMVTLIQLARTYSKVEPNAMSFESLLNEWQKEASKELDFRNEMLNQMRARNAMIRGNCNVEVPEVFPHLTFKRILTMSYVNGFKITDTDKLDYYKIDRTKLMTDICDAFAYQVHSDGMFHGDPHAGNILVTPPTSTQEARAVLLDWGLVKTYSRAEQIGIAKVVFAISTLDMNGLLEAFEEIGFEFKAGRRDLLDPEALMQAVKSQMSKQQDDPDEECEERTQDDEIDAEKEALKREKEILEKIREEYSADGAAGGLLGGNNDGKDGDDDASEDERVAGGLVSKKRLQQAMNDAKYRSRVNPLSSWPESIVLLLRTMALLYGLTKQLNVNVPFMQALVFRARQTLESRFLNHVNSIHNIIDLHAQQPMSFRSRFEKYLYEYYRNRLGTNNSIQIAVVCKKRVLCSLSFGQRSPVDLRAVTNNSLFPLGGISHLLQNLTLLKCVDMNLCELATPIYKIMPEFLSEEAVSMAEAACAHDEHLRSMQLEWRRRITVQHVLSQTTGIVRGVPSNFNLPLYLDIDACVYDFILGAPIDHPPGHRASYGYIFNSWLVSELVMRLLGGRNAVPGPIKFRPLFDGMGDINPPLPQTEQQRQANIRKLRDPWTLDKAFTQLVSSPLNLQEKLMLKLSVSEAHLKKISDAAIVVSSDDKTAHNDGDKSSSSPANTNRPRSRSFLGQELVVLQQREDTTPGAARTAQWEGNLVFSKRPVNVDKISQDDIKKHLENSKMHQIRVARRAAMLGTTEEEQGMLLEMEAERRREIKNIAHNKFTSALELLRKKPHLLDPLMHDARRISTRLMPLGARGCAEGLAKLVDGVASYELLSKETTDALFYLQGNTGQVSRDLPSRVPSKRSLSARNRRRIVSTDHSLGTKILLAGSPANFGPCGAQIFYFPAVMREFLVGEARYDGIRHMRPPYNIHTDFAFSKKRATRASARNGRSGSVDQQISAPSGAVSVCHQPVGVFDSLRILAGAADTLVLGQDSSAASDDCALRGSWIQRDYERRRWLQTTVRGRIESCLSSDSVDLVKSDSQEEETEVVPRGRSWFKRGFLSFCRRSPRMDESDEEEEDEMGYLDGEGGFNDESDDEDFVGEGAELVHGWGFFDMNGSFVLNIPEKELSVSVLVSDTGTGMGISKDLLDVILESFGMRLGWAVAKDIPGGFGGLANLVINRKKGDEDDDGLLGAGDFASLKEEKRGKYYNRSLMAGVNKGAGGNSGGVGSNPASPQSKKHQ